MKQTEYTGRLQRACILLKDALLNVYYTEDHLSDAGYKSIERAYEKAKKLVCVK